MKYQTINNEKSVRYSAQKIRELLNEALEAVAYWQEACLKAEKKVRELESNDPQRGTIRLPFGGTVR